MRLVKREVSPVCLNCTMRSFSGPSPLLALYVHWGLTSMGSGVPMMAKYRLCNAFTRLILVSQIQMKV